MLFYQPTKNCAQTFTRSTQSLVKYAEKPLFQSQTDKNTVLPAARKYTADRKQKASENAAEWTVRSLKMLINQGFSELKRSDSSIYIRYLKFSFLTVHTKIERRKQVNYKLKTVDAETLLSTPMSKTMFIVDGLIPQGVSVISGASKIGKSWLMLWLGLQISQGLPV